jgi:uncharacterized protein YjiS (DUF1127 family)
MSQLSASGPRSRVQRALDSLNRWRRRNQAIRELRTIARWRLADLGISADQIPAFVDALLERKANPENRVAPSEVQAGRTGWMLGPWADGVAAR